MQTTGFLSSSLLAACATPLLSQQRSLIPRGSSSIYLDSHPKFWLHPAERCMSFCSSCWCPITRPHVHGSWHSSPGSPLHPQHCRWLQNSFLENKIFFWNPWRQCTHNENGRNYGTWSKCEICIAPQFTQSNKPENSIFLYLIFQINWNISFLYGPSVDVIEINDSLPLKWKRPQRAKTEVSS